MASSTVEITTAESNKSAPAVSKLDCSICLSKFQEPKLLTCFHTFCLQCLEEYVIRNRKNGAFECPLCRSSIEIPAGGLKSFQANFYIDVDNLTKAEVDCDVCGNGQKSCHYCIECEEHFCERCAVAHSKMKMTREHKMVNLNDTIPTESGNVTRKVQKKSYCQHHSGEEVKMTCKDCNELLCVVCKLTDHENHSTSGIVKEAEQRRVLLSEKVKETQKAIETLKLKISKVEKCEEGIQKKLESDMKEIDEHVEEVIKKIRYDSEKMKEELTSSCTDALDYYKKQRKEFLEKVSEGDAVVAHAVNVIDVGDDINVLDNHLLTKLDSMTIAGENISVKLMTHLTFKPCRSTHAPYQLGETANTKIGFTVDEEEVICYNKVGNTKQAHVMALSAENVIAGFLDYSHLLMHNLTSYTFKTLQPLMNDIDCRTIFGMAGSFSGQCFFSHLPSKSLYMYPLDDKQSGKKVCKFKSYPYGIAFRPASKYCPDEILVCLLETKEYSKISETPFTGCVMAVPLGKSLNKYTWLVEETPGPACIAVNERNGNICLGYPSARKVTLHSPDGDLLSEYHGNIDIGSPAKFCPADVCFDPNDGIVIADIGNNVVIRTSEKGEFLQTLIQGGRPLSLALGNDYTMYVGFMDKNITRYQLKKLEAIEV